MTTKLSILICGLQERMVQCVRLHERINALSAGLPINTIVMIDNREMPTGEKRNKLIEQANGEYVAFVDDDDSVTDDYCSEIMKVIESRPDVVGMEGVLHLTGVIADKMEYRFIHSIECNGWYTGADGVFYRTPNHLNPVRKEIAQEVMFNPYKRIGEDYDYSMRLRPYLNKEVRISKPIYHYNYNAAKIVKK